MNTKILATVSAIALLAMAGPALAQTVVAEADIVAKPGSPQAAAQSTGSVKQDVENAWNDIKKDSSEAYSDIKATVVGDEQTNAGASSTVTIDPRMTADGIIGKPVYNASGESVATVRDIILDSNGKATMVVVGDGEFIGMGKKAAFDYNAIASINADGDVIMPLTEEMIDSAAEFSYDQANSGENVRVIPANGYSIAKLLEGDLINQKNEKIAEVENITLKNGRASQIIVGFDKILGMGGEKAALNFSDAKLIASGENDYDFQLSETQAAQFKTYKDTVAN